MERGILSSLICIPIVKVVPVGILPAMFSSTMKVAPMQILRSQVLLKKVYIGIMARTPSPLKPTMPKQQILQAASMAKSSGYTAQILERQQVSIVTTYGLLS